MPQVRQMVTQKHGLTEQLLNSNEHFLSFVATTRIPPAQLLVKPFYMSVKQVHELGIQI